MTINRYLLPVLVPFFTGNYYILSNNDHYLILRRFSLKPTSTLTISDFSGS